MFEDWTHIVFEGDNFHVLVHDYVKKCSRFYCSDNIKNQQSVYTNSDTQLMRECYRDGQLTGKIIWHKDSWCSSTNLGGE